MNLLLEISFYIFLLIVIFGGGLLIWLFRWIFGEKDILAIFPQTQPLPQPALAEVKKLLNKIRSQVPKVSPARQMVLLKDLGMMDKTVQEVEFRTKNQQTHYHQLCKERETMWEALQKMVEQMPLWEQMFWKKKNPAYIQAVQSYKELTQRIEKATEHAKFQGELLLAEIRNRAIYQQYAYLLNASKNETLPPQEPWQEPHPTLEKQQAPPDATKPTQLHQNISQDTPSFLKDAPPHETPSKVHPQYLEQADFPNVGINLKQHQYIDPTFNLAFEATGNLHHYDFEGSFFRGVCFEGIHQYTHCNFKNVDFTGAAWLRMPQPHRFDDCDFSGANLTDCLWEYTAFYYCRFDHAQWARIRLQKVKFVSCSMQEVHWENVNFSQVVMSKDMLASLDFSLCGTLPKNHPERIHFHEAKSTEKKINSNLDQEHI